jgi:hypothetical protein
MLRYVPGDLVTKDPSVYESNVIDRLLVCKNCGGQLRLVGKAGVEPFYRF